MSHHDPQLRLPLPAPPRRGDQPLVPVRMVNEWVYCPRLAWLMWVDGEWADTGDTEAGRRAHARADAGGGAMPSAGEAADEDWASKARAVTMSSDRLGLIAKMDIVEAEGGVVTPVDIKKGRRPHVEKGAYEPERVQVCLQALILEDNGYRVEEAALWYAGSRERVRVELDKELRARSLQAASDLRLSLAAGRRPAPLANSPKCVRCALAGICLPDEVRWFDRRNPPRPLNPADDPAMPLHVVTPGARIGKKGDALIITTPDGEKTKAPLISISDVSLFGPVSVSTPAMGALLRQGANVAWFSTGGWFLGLATNASLRSAHVRKEQYRASFDDVRRLAAARGLVEAKIRNQRTLLRRNWRKESTEADRADVLRRLKRLAERAPHARDAAQLLGLEGEAAAIYFRHFHAMLTHDAPMPFDFTLRNRRPPRDPVNAMLSFAYAILARQMTAILTVTGFDPWRGFYHAARPGRPSLALDMMEPYRPIIADSVVITAINTGEVTPQGFVSNGTSCALKPAARKAFLRVYERRMEQETAHPLFGYRVSMRRLLEVQMRLFSRWLEGEIKSFPHYLPR